jgi:hypothetical protein
VGCPVSTLPALGAPAVLLGRCTPYGAELGGPRRVMGGLHGPASAATPDAGLPLNVEQGEWLCRQPAQVRVRMECRCNHQGSVMSLCSWHEEISYVGERVAGNFRRVKKINRVRGHYEEIQSRQAGACTRCLYPGKYAGWYHELFSWQGHLAALRDAGFWYTDQAESIRRKITDMTAQFDQGNQDGTIHRCPMRLVPVS